MWGSREDTEVGSWGKNSIIIELSQSIDRRTCYVNTICQSFR